MQACGVDEWAWQLKQTYFEKAMYHLEEIAVVSTRKAALQSLASFLIQREH
jgi:geranylgeranyl diphosphate synthase type II